MRISASCDSVDHIGTTGKVDGIYSWQIMVVYLNSNG
jgi:hypothetical protein